MQTVGIICEYNPLHLGHQKQIMRIRKEFGSSCAVVCAMSGNYVQRGAPAILDKSIRATAAVMCGADLVLELPLTTSLSSAEGFAAGGVTLLSRLCDILCFGSETGNISSLLEEAEALMSSGFSSLLHAELATGKSFPAARQAALEAMGLPASVLAAPNDVLGVEYCKAILSQNSSMVPFPILREGSYHAQEPDPENPSATALRYRMLSSGEWKSFLPPSICQLFEGAPLHSLEAGEKAILTCLRTMTDSEFEALPYGSEGLWRKLMRESRRQATLEDIITSVKSKRYTRTRLDRMIMCAFLGITQNNMEAEVPYYRILAFSDRGRALLKSGKKLSCFRNSGQKVDHPYWSLEKKAGDLYGLFSVKGIEPSGTEENRRVVYLP